MEYCDRCKKNIAMMYISGKTKLCLDCYNQWMAEVYGLDVDSFQYPKNIAVTDRQGDLHFFNLHHIFFGSMVHWDADEENGDYHVEMDAPSEEPADRQLHNFHKKIAEKLWNRSLEKHSIDGYELTSLQELLALKAAIRRSEARGAVRSFGLDDDHNVHFLNLPFYESGGVTKLPRTQKDLDIIKELILELKPDQIYMAGDLADPHGTHRVCTEAALEAIEQLKEEGNEWLDDTTIWLYRGAWMEWELWRVDMAVPLSPDELIEKRHAIFRHLSQNVVCNRLLYSCRPCLL